MIGLSQNMGELHGKFTVSPIWFHVNFFRGVRISDKMQVVYKEMTCHGAKSALAKWNLIGGIPFKYVKNYPMFM